MAWNGYRHFELYYAVTGIGAVCHTINPRLFADQIIYVINHAKDRIIFIDQTFVPIVEKLVDRLPNDLIYVILCNKGDMPDTSLPKPLCFEELISSEASTISWPKLDERAASSLCYTSGTTGNPKGVLYSHRSILLHTFGMLTFAADVGLTPSSTVLPVVPLFHANAWGLPFAVPLVGAKLVFQVLHSMVLVFFFNGQRKSKSSLGVPTIWLGLLAEMRKQKENLKISHLCFQEGLRCQGQ